jgi:cell division protein FtsQ
MLPKPRARVGKRLGWPFGRRRNRRVRKGPSRADLTPSDVIATVAQPSPERPERQSTAPTRLPPPPRPSLWARARAWLLRHRRGIVTASVGLVVGAGAWAGRWYVTHAHHFQVQQVRVTPLHHVSAEALIARAAVPLGINLFSVDRDEVARNVSQEPWIARVKVRLELPATIMIDAVEREAACGVVLGALYLADSTGMVFKRATPDEAALYPVVTGIARDVYLGDPEHARADVRSALSAIAAWNARPGAAERGRLGEVHVDRVAGLTLYTDNGVGVRLGAVDDSVPLRLARLDAVMADLAQKGERPRLIYVDNRARPDRVTVKLASAAIAAHSGKSGTN